MTRSTSTSASHARPGERSEEAAASQQPQNSRRKALRTLGKLGMGAAALSFATFGPNVRKALAQSTEGPAGILNFALTLEYLEAAFYNQGLEAGVIPDGMGRDVYTLIAEHENEHVALLEQAIPAAGGELIDPLSFDDFDFTAGGALPDIFENPDDDSSYAVYLALSQAFEDTGVRAYKGQAANIPGDLTVLDLNVLTVALQIHSLEARHAAEVRRMRAMMGSDVEPWVSDPLAGFSGLGLEDDNPVIGVLEMVYAGEDNVTQGGLDLTDALSDNDYSDEQIREAFDEPLTMDAVNAIAANFLDPQNGDNGDDNDSD